MEKRNRHRSMGKLMAAAAVGLTGVAASQADAGLVVDVRATHVNGQAYAGNVRDVTVSGPGDVVTLAVFAQVSGTNGLNDETVQAAVGSFLSSGGLKGNISGNVTAPFNGSGHLNGVQLDADTDGDLDLGPAQGSGVAANYFTARSNAQEGGVAVLDSQSEEIQVGVINFTVTGGEGETFLKFIRRMASTGANQVSGGTWAEDGGNLKSPNTSPMAPTSANVRIAVVPEPTGLALAGLASLGLLARRRNAKA